MKRKFLATILTVIFSSLIMTTGNGQAVRAEDIQTDIINIPDPVLKQNLVSRCDENGDGEVSKAEILTLDSLITAEGDNITDLTGLQYADNIKSIFIKGCDNKDNPSPMDISAVASMKNLSSFRVLGYSDVTIKDYSPLKEVKNLNNLSFVYCKNIDTNVIGSLNNLNGLRICDCNISDFSFVSGLSNLTDLDIEGGEKDIENIDFVQNMSNLTDLKISHGKLTSFKPLENLQKLVHLTVTDDNVQDLSPISKLTNLTMLYIGGNGITDISPLSSLSNLKYLGMQGNKVTDISPIKDLDKMVELEMQENAITDISVLKNMHDLKELDISSNPITDISPIGSINNLEYVTADKIGKKLSSKDILDIINIAPSKIEEGDSKDIKISPNDIYYDREKSEDDNSISEDISAAVTCNIKDSTIASIADGKITGLKIGDTSCTVKYKDLEKEIPIKVVAKGSLQDQKVDSLNRIEIKSEPSKKSYIVGEDINLDGAVLSAVYESGKEEDINITKEMIQGFDSSKAQDNIITVNYLGKSAQFTINIKEKEQDTDHKGQVGGNTDAGADKGQAGVSTDTAVDKGQTGGDSKTDGTDKESANSKDNSLALVFAITSIAGLSIAFYSKKNVIKF